MLYFKYLLALNPIDKQRVLGYKKPKLSGKVLYIDDEWAKGWSDIFKSYFPSNIKFETFEKNFKDVNIFSLQGEIKEYVTQYNPDVVLLDLRLVVKDHTREEIENLTGIKITKMIKEINPAIQVIIFTATNKSRILEKLYEEKILGYIKKAHPEDKNLTTKDSFAKLAELIDSGLEKKYLKEIWTIQNTVLELDLTNEIIFEVKSIFEILDSDMEKRYTYAMLSIFQSLEEINNIYINDKTKKWIDGYVNIVIEGNGYTKQKIEAVLKKLDLFQEFNSEIYIISKMRKNAIHPPQKSKYDKPTKDNILIWFKMLQIILKKVSDDKPNH